MGRFFFLSFFLLIGKGDFMNRLARACLAFLVAFNLVIFQLAPVAHAEEMTAITVTEPPVSQYATAPVDSNPLVTGLIKPDGTYFKGINTVQQYMWWTDLELLDAEGVCSMNYYIEQGYSNVDRKTPVWTASHYLKSSCDFIFIVPNDDLKVDGFTLYSCDDGVVSKAASRIYMLTKRHRYCNFPVFVSREAGEYFYKYKKLRSENDLNTSFLPDGYAYNETLGLVKSSSSSVEVGTYDENIGYPINFDYKGNLLSMNTARSSTWDFYKDANGNAITRSAEEENYNIEIFLNFDLKNDYLNNLTNGFTSEFEDLQMPARALSYYDGSANSCSCIYENWGITMERAFQYFRDKVFLNMNDFLATNTYYFNTKNLNVWARYYYLDEAGEKHFGDWVKWSKEGLSVVHEDTASGTESTVEDAVPFGPEYKSSFLEKEQGYDADEQKITIDGITINVSPYFESQEDDPEYYPTETDSPGDNSGDNSGDNGSSGSGDNGSSGSGVFSKIGEILGNLIGGIVELFVGLVKAISNSIYKITKSIGEFLSSISNVGDIFGTVFGWMPGEIVALLSLAILACIVCRVLGR